jgi:hypothetical protein
MPKKSRRTKAKHLARSAEEIQRRQHKQVPAAAIKPQPTATMSPISARVPPKTQDYTDRYRYVMTEIKHIGIFAGGIILVLTVLSFVLG